HIHVRLICPAQSMQCLPSTSTLPEGDGCDKTLDWWFSDEARELGQKPSEMDRKVDLPEACLEVLKNPEVY
ncbi:MAG: penicillin-insensitive murein endopeptidase, partial [Pseudomonadota bacterium]